MMFRTAMLVVACGLCALAQVPARSTTVLVSLIDRPVGREIVSTTTDGTSTTYTGDLDLTERGGRLQVSSSMTMTAAEPSALPAFLSES